MSYKRVTTLASVIGFSYQALLLQLTVIALEGNIHRILTVGHITLYVNNQYNTREMMIKLTHKYKYSCM